MPLTDAHKINWHAPWLAHLQQSVHGAANATDLKAALNAQATGLYSGNQQPIRFVAQKDLPNGVAYESHIFDTGYVPTRLNLHDFFNACIWLTFPKTKAILNARQAQDIKRHGIRHERGVARDALTLFDENAALLVTADAAVAQALRDFDWHNALVSTRSQWDIPFSPQASARAALYPFGHALLEKLTVPYAAICAHTWVVLVDDDWFAQPLSQRLTDLDRRLAQQLSDIDLNPRDFCPLPVLGVPHYWADNVDETFYNDTRVFRSGRTRLDI